MELNGGGYDFVFNFFFPFDSIILGVNKQLFVWINDI